MFSCAQSQCIQERVEVGVGEDVRGGGGVKLFKCTRSRIIYKTLEQQSMVHHQKYPFFTFDLYLGVKGTQNVAHYPLHHVTYAPAKFEDAMSNGLGDTFTGQYIIYDIGVNVAHNVAQYPPHYMI